MMESMHFSVYADFVRSRQWYYEVEVLNASYIRCGWARPSFAPEPQKGRGVGDDADSYGFAGLGLIAPVLIVKLRCQ